MRITIVHSNYRPGMPSGENHAVHQQASALARAGFEVSIVGADSGEISGGPMSFAQIGLRVATGRGRSPLAELTETKPDIIHVHNLFPSWGEDWIGELRVPLVLTLHNFRYFCANGLLYRDGKFCRECIDFGSYRAVAHGCYRSSRVASIPLSIANRRGADRPLFRSASKIIALSERSKIVFESAGLAREKIRLIPNFSSNQEVAGELQPPRTRSGWMFAGRLTENKGLLDVLQQWPDGENLDIYGAGPESKKIADMNLPNVNLRGEVSPEEVGRLFSQYEGHIFSSKLTENCPLSYLQALAAGTPTLASHGNAVSDDIFSNATGFGLENWALLPRAMQAVREDSALAVRCRAVHSRKYSESTWVENMAKLYSEV